MTPGAGWAVAGQLAASAATGVALAALAHMLVRPAPRLARRVRPYTIAARTRLGRRPDALAMTPAGGGALGRLAERLGRLADGRSDEALALRLEQADLLDALDGAERVREYRARQLVATVTWTGAFAALGLVAGVAAAPALALAGLGAIVGATRWPGRVERALQRRRERMRVELYTVNHLLAMHLRTGGGVVQALRRVTERGRGAVVDELTQALTLHRSGRTVADALDHVARRTPEPNAARTYRLLAGGVRYGSDLAEALRVLSDDLREQRLEALKRDATRRRAAMLVPIVAVLAPVMLLFIAAPLPSLVLGAT